jgi:hypothetical protein
VTADEQLLHKALEALLAKQPQHTGLVYRMAPDFVLRHGVWFERIPWRKGWKQGAPLCCFGNAIAAGMLNGWRYIEGYALAPTGKTILHAWNATEEGTLIDTTWCNTGLAYLGIEFSVGRADDATWNGDQCVLDDCKRGWPLFQQEWRGEPEGVAWQPSEAVRFMLSQLKKLKKGGH